MTFLPSTSRRLKTSGWLLKTMIIVKNFSIDLTRQDWRELMLQTEVAFFDGKKDAGADLSSSKVWTSYLPLSNSNCKINQVWHEFWEARKHFKMDFKQIKTGCIHGWPMGFKSPVLEIWGIYVECYNIWTLL